MVVGEIDAALVAGVAVGGTGVGGNGVDGAAVGFRASATGGGCFCVLGGSSAGVVTHPIAMTDTIRSQISFIVMGRLVTLSPFDHSKFDEPVALRIT